MPDLDELRRLAVAAKRDAPGEWEQEGRYVWACDSDVSIEAMRRARDGRWCDLPSLSAYIAAANPQTVIALLDRLERAERRNQYIERSYAALVQVFEMTADSWANLTQKFSPEQANEIRRIAAKVRGFTPVEASAWEEFVSSQVTVVGEADWGEKEADDHA